VDRVAVVASAVGTHGGGTVNTTTINGRHKRDRSEILDSMPPVALEREQALLSAVMYAGAIDQDVVIPPYVFHDERNQAIWSALVTLDAEHGKIDAAALLDTLKKDRRWGQYGLDSAYVIGEVAQARGAVGRQQEHAEQIHAAYIKRTVRSHTERILQKVSGVCELSELVELLDSAKAVIDGPRSKESLPFYPALTCAELMAAVFVVRFYVSRILAVGQPLVFAGPKKALKTTLLVALMLALATGTSFLGTFEVFAAIAVGMMTGESGLPTIQESIRRIAATMGIEPAGINNMIITDKVPQLGDARHLDAVRDFIAKHGLKVLIIDPVYMAMSGADAGNLFIQGQLLRGISELCQELDCTLILCHHTKKSALRSTGRESFEPPELEDIAWAGFQEWARQWLLVGRREAYEPGSGVHRLWLTAGGSIGHGGRWGIDISEGTHDTEGGRFWGVSVIDGRDIMHERTDRKEVEKTERAEAAAERDCERLKEAMARFPDGETAKALRELVGFSGNKFSVALARLIRRTEVEHCEIIKPNRRTPYDAYRLKDLTTPS
jgi:hypothetical protein